MIELHKVSLTRNRINIFDELSMQIPSHQVFGVFGEDSLCRSMLLKIAAGLEEPGRGRVLVDDEPVYAPGSRAYQKTGYLSGDCGCYSHLKLEEYYEMALSLYKIHGRNSRARMEEIFDLLEIGEYKDRYLEEASREMIPVFGLGAAILHDPDWLILNEPFEYTDVYCRKKMIDAIRILCEEGMSVLINTQVIPELTGFLTDIAVIEDKAITISGSIEDVLAEEMVTCPVRMQVIENMDEALKVLKENPVVERVTVDRQEVVFWFSGDEREEAHLLSAVTAAGALVRNYHRDRVHLEDILRR